MGVLSWPHRELLGATANGEMLAAKGDDHEAHRAEPGGAAVEAGGGEEKCEESSKRPGQDFFQAQRPGYAEECDAGVGGAASAEDEEEEHEQEEDGGALDREDLLRAADSR